MIEFRCDAPMKFYRCRSRAGFGRRRKRSGHAFLATRGRCLASRRRPRQGCCASPLPIGPHRRVVAARNSVPPNAKAQYPAASLDARSAESWAVPTLGRYRITCRVPSDHSHLNPSDYNRWSRSPDRSPLCSGRGVLSLAFGSLAGLICSTGPRSWQAC